VFIPTYNEAENIKEIITKINNLDLELDLYVIDDGSKDNTYEVSLESGVKVIRHYINLGGGAAIRTAFKTSIINNAKYIITLDGDGQHDPYELINMINIMEEKKPSILIGSRFLINNKRKMKNYRYIGIKFFSYIVSIMAGINLTDVTSCYRIYDADMVKNILPDLKENQYYAIELIFKTIKNNGKIIETPIKDINRAGGESKKGILRYCYNLIRVVLKNLF
jgi:glycosyltransferase involved in cell wall biosynthesis